MENKMNLMGSTTAHLRKQAKGILTSYGNPWDIIAELLQNAIDAIRKGMRKGNLHIMLDKRSGTIRVQENGIGMSPIEMPIQLQAFSSDKEDDEELVGEKGVGIDYVILETELFEAISGTDQGVTRVIVKNAHTWVHDKTNNEDLEMEIEDITANDPTFRGTIIKASGIQNCDLFDMSFKQLETIIRTKTAVGSTKVIFGTEDLKVEVMLEVVDKNGKTEKALIPFGYQLPTEKSRSSTMMNLDKFIKKYEGTHIKDSRKIAALKNKTLYIKGELEYKVGRTLRYFALYVPSRAAWGQLAEQLGIKPSKFKTKQEEEAFKSKFEYLLPGKGIFTSVKGMPTGISINPPVAGNDGYWPNLFIIIEDPGLSFDIGRKVIYGSQQKILKKIAKEIFKKFVNSGIPSLIGPIVVSPPGVFNRYKIYRELEDVPTLNASYTNFTKVPNGQEATVSAMFYELAGSGFLEGYKFLSSGYKQIYDLYVQSHDNFLVFEFKSKLLNIIKELGETKGFEQVDCIVCWDVDDRDDKTLAKENIELELLDEDTFSPGREDFPLATHQLHLSNVQKRVFVIDLKRVYEAIAKGEISPVIKPELLRFLRHKLQEGTCPVCLGPYNEKRDNEAI